MSELAVAVAMRGIAPERLKENNAFGNAIYNHKVAMRGIAPERLKVNRQADEQIIAAQGCHEGYRA